ncbi:MAG: ABC transporter substrate-binding protein [Deltaproteobacteria bacterium]|nr:ABC transporter substrate-binding protein [Deltaproteobacteria bacterium]
MKKLLAASCCFLTAAWCWLFSATGFAAAPLTPSQLALYQGADREKILVEGAKREGQFTLYTSHTWFRTFVKEFEKKYPFVKANEWRNDSKTLIRKVLEEAKSGRVLVDVVESTADGMGLIKREGLFQEYYSPEARYYPSELKPKGKNGFFYLPNRETYSSLGFNTKLIPPANAPRSLKDLIDPRWKGKMAITGTSTGVRWIGNVLDVMGREFLEKLAEQDISVQNMAPAALINLIGSGEVPMSPTILDANVTMAKQKGAPVE